MARLEAALKQLGETLESAYDEAYIARKDAALHRAGIKIVRLQVEPQDISVNQGFSGKRPTTTSDAGVLQVYKTLQVGVRQICGVELTISFLVSII